MSTEDDLRDMTSALNFAVRILRSELGPGGLMEREPAAVRSVWGEAADFLSTTTDYPMIPLHMWRTRDVEEVPSGDA